MDPLSIRCLSGRDSLADWSGILAASGADSVLMFLRLGVMPLYAIIAVIAVLGLPPPGARLATLQLEALLFCLMIFLSTQIA